MKRNKTPLYQEVEKEEVEKEEVIRKPDVDYTFTGGKYQGSILSKSSEGNLSFKKDGGIIHLDPNSSSAKFLLKQQKHRTSRSACKTINARFWRGRRILSRTRFSCSKRTRYFLKYKIKKWKKLKK